MHSASFVVRGMQVRALHRQLSAVRLIKPQRSDRWFYGWGLAGSNEVTDVFPSVRSKEAQVCKNRNWHVHGGFLCSLRIGNCPDILLGDTACIHGRSARWRTRALPVRKHEDLQLLLVSEDVECRPEYRPLSFPWKWCCKKETLRQLARNQWKGVPAGSLDLDFWTRSIFYIFEQLNYKENISDIEKKLKKGPYLLA